MKCEEFEMMIAESLGSELAESDRPALEAHLAECPRCREELRAAEGLLLTMRSIPGPTGQEVFGGRPESIGSSDPRFQESSAWILRKSVPLLRYAAIILAAFGAGYFVRSTNVSMERDGVDHAATVDSIARKARPDPDGNEMRTFEAALSGAYRRNPGGSDLAKCMRALFPTSG